MQNFCHKCALQKINSNNQFILKVITQQHASAVRLDHPLSEAQRSLLSPAAQSLPGLLRHQPDQFFRTDHPAPRGHTHHSTCKTTSARYHTLPTDTHLTELKRVKQYVRDLQIEIATLRQNQLPPAEVCEECQRHRRKHATTKHHLGQLRQQNTELSSALEEANKVIAELQDENTALSHATRTLKKKAEKLLHLAQKRDALREETRQLSGGATGAGCAHRHCQPGVGQREKYAGRKKQLRKEHEEDIVKKKWERFRNEVAHLKGQDYMEAPPRPVRDDPAGMIPRAPDNCQRHHGDYYAAQPAGSVGLQHPRTADAMQMMQPEETTRGINIKPGYKRCCNNPANHTHDGYTPYPPERQAARPVPTHTSHTAAAAPRKKVMSATELDKWTRFYAKKQAGDARRQQRTAAYLAHYTPPAGGRHPERTMSAGERLERFRQQHPVAGGQGGGAADDYAEQHPRNVSLAGTDAESKDRGEGPAESAVGSESEDGCFAEGQSEGVPEAEGFDKDGGLECVNAPLREIICQIDSMANA
ncbi:uncharacterized protein LOC129582865 [Paramacrobiotus metropolitanus]|uniref:uncharacterized protein LOC129582865 n=1 Tax=Paramacrobiotus metropolitanus TaxID=2943436 RepID=UPI0024457DF6|nr:uncharacterized protein LOC129582865 [Paramacrobiotus metropolitanus]